MINRRRAPSSEVSRSKKIAGHKVEDFFASIIDGTVIKGTQKGDVIDKNKIVYSVKSGKKWQILLYSYKRICQSTYLKILQPCLDSFTKDYIKFVNDRVSCISYKEKYQEKFGKEKAKLLSNDEVNKKIGPNSYTDAKKNLSKATLDVVKILNDKEKLNDFLSEAIFNINEVSFLAIQDEYYKRDKSIHVFSKETVLSIICKEISCSISSAGNVPIDYNVPGQKTIFKYKKNDGKQKNIIEIEVRTDSESKYRSIRFNMYSKDTLYLLLERNNNIKKKEVFPSLFAYGSATEIFN
tara:strand:- start:1389 stop:2273 length:885 start_codon:yes stop_codon:yes gene_type:complete